MPSRDGPDWGKMKRTDGGGRGGDTTGGQQPTDYSGADAEPPKPPAAPPPQDVEPPATDAQPEAAAGLDDFVDLSEPASQAELDAMAADVAAEFLQPLPDGRREPPDAPAPMATATPMDPPAESPQTPRPPPHVEQSIDDLTDAALDEDSPAAEPPPFVTSRPPALPTPPNDPVFGPIPGLTGTEAGTGLQPESESLQEGDGGVAPDDPAPPELDAFEPQPAAEPDPDPYVTGRPPRVTDDTSGRRTPTVIPADQVFKPLIETPRQRDNRQARERASDRVGVRGFEQKPRGDNRTQNRLGQRQERELQDDLTDRLNDLDRIGRAAARGQIDVTPEDFQRLTAEFAFDGDRLRKSVRRERELIEAERERGTNRRRDRTLNDRLGELDELDKQLDAIFGDDERQEEGDRQAADREPGGDDQPAQRGDDPVQTLVQPDRRRPRPTTPDSPEGQERRQTPTDGPGPRGERDDDEAPVVPPDGRDGERVARESVDDEGGNAVEAGVNDPRRGGTGQTNNDRSRESARDQRLDQFLEAYTSGRLVLEIAAEVIERLRQQ